MNSTAAPHVTPFWLEVAAALLVPSAIVGFARVFAEPSAIVPVLGASLLSSAVAVAGRRLGLPLLLTALASFTLLGLLIVNAYAPGTATAGLVPTGATVDRLQALISDLVANFEGQKSPVPTLDSFVATSMVAAWVMAFLTDWGAMRLRLAFEPVFPSALIFLFTAIPPIAVDQYRVAATVVFALGLINWAVAQRLAKLIQHTTWLPAHEKLGPSTLARGALALSALALLAGVITGPRIPWADAEPMFSFAQQRDPVRRVPSPFIEIDKRLVDQRDEVLFTVEAAESTYWRIAGLDKFEGNLWKVEGDFSPEDGDLPGQSLGGQRRELRQKIEIRALAAIWLPAAFAPARIESTSAELTWNGESSSLTVSNGIDSSDGVVYEITSSVPDFSVDELRAAPATIPANIAETYLDVPLEVTPRVAAEAQQVTAGLTTRYDQMLALQNYFQQNFNYSIDLGPRGADPIETFLDERVGFCQQFSGTFALMARSLGVPTRVATGFTWGTPTTTPDGANQFIVTGRHAHAWPEVYFEGLGWVPFEPTPGRGLPGAANYTNVTPGQDDLVEGSQAPEPEAAAEPAAEPEAIPEPDPQTTPEDPSQPELELGPDAEETGADTDGFSFPSIPWRWLAAIAALSAYPAMVFGARFLRRRNRRAMASSANDRVSVAWTEACEEYDLTLTQVRAPSETRTEFAGRLVDDGAIAGADMRQLAELATAARFSAHSLDDSSATQAEQLSSSITSAVADLLPIQNRTMRILDPRRVIRRRSPRQLITEGRKQSTNGQTGDLIEVGNAKPE